MTAVQELIEELTGNGDIGDIPLAQSETEQDGTNPGGGTGAEGAQTAATATAARAAPMTSKYFIICQESISD